MIVLLLLSCCSSSSEVAAEGLWTPQCPPTCWTSSDTDNRKKSCVTSISVHPFAGMFVLHVLALIQTVPTLTLTACPSLSGSAAAENSRNISPSVDSPLALTCLLSYALLSERLNMASSVFSDLSFADFFYLSDSCPVRGIQTRTLRWRIVWMG